MRRSSRSLRQQRRIDGLGAAIRQAGNGDLPFPRQRHARHRARLRFIAGPEDIVDDRDASTGGDGGRLRSQCGKRRRPQIPYRHADGRAPIPVGCHRLDFRGEQARDRSALQSCEWAGGKRRRLPAMQAGQG
jgi:hypothetical protein